MSRLGWLFLAWGLVGCALGNAPAPGPSASAAALPGASALPSASPSPELSIVMSALDGLQLPVGGQVRLVASSTWNAPVNWWLAARDQGSAHLDASPMPDGGSTATVQAIAPGAAEVYAEVGGQRAHALLACVAAPASIAPIPFPSGLPSNAPGATEKSGVRVIASQADWTRFWGEVGAVGSPPPAPVEFNKSSIVATITNVTPTLGKPVVVDVAGGDAGMVHLVTPAVIGYHVAVPAWIQPNVITLTKVPMVPATVPVDWRTPVPPL